MASRQDLDNWAQLGNEGWDFDGLLPYYKKFETYHPASETLGRGMDDKYLDKDLRGTDGPIHVSRRNKQLVDSSLTIVDLLRGDRCRAYPGYLA